MVTDRGAEADHTGLKFFAVDGDAAAPHDPKLLHERFHLGDRARREARHTAGLGDAAHLAFRQPG